MRTPLSGTLAPVLHPARLPHDMIRSALRMLRKIRFSKDESFRVRHPRLVRELADRRVMDAARLAPLAGLVAEWHRAGYLHCTAGQGRNG